MMISMLKVEFIGEMRYSRSSYARKHSAETIHLDEKFCFRDGMHCLSQWVNCGFTRLFSMFIEQYTKCVSDNNWNSDESHPTLGTITIFNDRSNGFDYVIQIPLFYCYLIHEEASTIERSFVWKVESINQSVCGWIARLAIFLPLNSSENNWER